jgi:hypothetical protein
MNFPNWIQYSMNHISVETYFARETKEDSKMAYSDFSLDDAIQKLALVERSARLFDNVETLEMSDWLKETFSMSLDLGRFSPSEKARSEFIVAPILLEIGRRAHKRFALHSGKRLDVDPQQGLNGECDFILAKGELSHTIRAPIFALVEAKKNDIELGLGQCAAQMVGARIFNQNRKNDIDTIFGCVTTGEDWLFLKLEDSTLFIDIDRYYIDNVGKILGVLQSIVDYY